MPNLMLELHILCVSLEVLWIECSPGPMQIICIRTYGHVHIHILGDMSATRAYLAFPASMAWIMDLP